MQVFASSLRFIHLRLLQIIRDAALAGNSISNTQILWVLTVPAIWSDAAKSLMRQAALEAGLISDLSSDQLLLCLEPEAAGLATHADMKDMGQSLPGRSKYLIVDCGGICQRNLFQQNFVSTLRSFLPPGDRLC